MLLKKYEHFYCLTYTSHTNARQSIVAILHTSGKTVLKCIGSRLRAKSKKGPISNSFSTHLVEKFQRYREFGLPIRVHLKVDARSESGADFFYMLINAHTLECAFIKNEAFPVFTTMKQRLKGCKQLTISFELMVAFEVLVW